MYKTQSFKIRRVPLVVEVTRDKRYLFNNIKENPKTSALKVTRSIELELGKIVHAECVRKVLQKSGYNGRSVKRIKPRISDVNRTERLKFGRKYENEEHSFCDKVLSTDETKVNLLQSDG
ncbi:hypothetical protein Trydic_g23727 [Trypoxylus dichotomus]